MLKKLLARYDHDLIICHIILMYTLGIAWILFCVFILITVLKYNFKFNSMDNALIFNTENAKVLKNNIYYKDLLKLIWCKLVIKQYNFH